MQIERESRETAGRDGAGSPPGNEPELGLSPPNFLRLFLADACQIARRFGRVMDGLWPFLETT